MRYFLTFRKVKVPVVSQEPTFKLENNGKRIVLHILVMSAVMPDFSWSFGNKPLKQGGRYNMKAVKQGTDYCVILEVDEVSID